MIGRVPHVDDRRSAARYKATMIRAVLATLAALLPLAAPPQQPPQPLARAYLPARAAQLARAYTAICRADDMALAAMRSRAATQGFTALPNGTRNSRRAFSNGSVVTDLLLLFPAGDATRPHLLSAMITEERDGGGQPTGWACEVRLPASGFAVPPGEAKAVFRIVRTILARPDWQVETKKTQMGPMTGSSRNDAGFEETYAGGIGAHLLSRRPLPSRSVVTIPVPR
jgi:hypothetical protein